MVDYFYGAKGEWFCSGIKNYQNLALKCKDLVNVTVLLLLAGFSLQIPWKEFKESHFILTFKLFAFKIVTIG